MQKVQLFPLEILDFFNEFLKKVGLGGMNLLNVGNYTLIWKRPKLNFRCIYTSLFIAGVTLSRNWHQMAIRIWNFEFRAKMAPNLVNSQWTAEASTMPTEDHTMAPEPHTKATRRCDFYSSLYPQDTRRPHDGYTTSYWEYDAFELEHEGVTWPPDGIKLSAVGNSVADRRHDDNNN